MANLLELSVEARFTDTNKTQLGFVWPYQHIAGTQTGHVRTLTPDEGKFLTVDALTGGGETVDLADLTTVTAFGVYNSDGTNFVNVTVKNAAAATVVTKLLPGDIFITPDVDPTVNPTLAADTAACICNVFAVGT